MLASLYNKRSMKRYGWDPTWLELSPDASAKDIVGAVKVFQVLHNLSVDGKVGPMTFRRLEAHKELLDLEMEENVISRKGRLIIGGVPHKVPFKVVNYLEKGGLSLYPSKHYRKRKGSVNQWVWHWDATLSAKHCHRILSGKRRASSHGCIDNDGTFYQFLDFQDVYSWHSGIGAVNKKSVGIDFSNAVYKKYNRWYTSKGYGPRPEIKAETNGHRHNLLGYYPEQIETAAHLFAVANKIMNIPLVWPGNHKRFKKTHLFDGHYGHYHCLKGKWDPAGMPWEEIIKKAKEILENEY